MIVECFYYFYLSYQFAKCSFLLFKSKSKSDCLKATFNWFKLPEKDKKIIALLCENFLTLYLSIIEIFPIVLLMLIQSFKLLNKTIIFSDFFLEVITLAVFHCWLTNCSTLTLASFKIFSEYSLLYISIVSLKLVVFSPSNL